MKLVQFISVVCVSGVLAACGADVVGSAATTGSMQAGQAQQAQQQVQQVSVQLDAAALQAQAQRQAAEDASK